MSIMLSENEKQAFTKVLCRLIRADGNFDVNEIHFLGDFGTRYGIPIAEINEQLFVPVTENINQSESLSNNQTTEKEEEFYIDLVAT